METIPWYQSAIIRQQIVGFLTAAFGLLGWSKMIDIDIDQTVGLVLGGVGALVSVWTIITRIRKPAPNLSQTAANKEAELRARGTFVEPTATRQGGFFRPALMFVVAALSIGLAVAVLPGCAGTQAAYKAASHSEQALPDTAYVVAEHYAAVVHEAANLASLSTTPPELKAAMKSADAAVKPWVLGDAATGKPGLRDLAQRYQEVKTAANAEELQRAIDAAVLELAKLINAVKAARR